jgi:integrase
MSELLLDRAGRRRSPATVPGFHGGRAPGNKGLRYPADPPNVEEIIAVMRAAGERPHGWRLRGLIVILWRTGLRIQEALALTEADIDPRRRRAAGPARQGRTPPRGRNGRMGLRTTAALARTAARRRTTDRHPAPTRAKQPRHHVGLPPRHRQRRDHRDRPRPPRSDDPCQRLAAAVIDPERAAASRARQDSPRVAAEYSAAGHRGSCSGRPAARRMLRPFSRVSARGRSIVRAKPTRTCSEGSSRWSQSRRASSSADAAIRAVSSAESKTSLSHGMQFAPRC